MPRNILRNRVHGCMVQSNIGGPEPDKFEVLDANDKEVLFSFDTMAGASEGAKVISALRRLADVLDDPQQFQEFAAVSGKVSDGTLVALQEKRAATKAEKAQAAKPPAQPAAQQPPQATQEATQQPQQPAAGQQPVAVPPQQDGPAAAPATAPPTQEQPQQETPDGGADIGRLHAGDETLVAGQGTDGAQPATPAPASPAEPAVAPVAPAEGVPQPAAGSAPAEDGGVNLL